MSADWMFNADPPITDREAFERWHETVGEEHSRPNANIEDDGSLWINGSWGRIGAALPDFWPALLAWSQEAGIKLTFYRGEYCPEGFDPVPEEDHWKDVFKGTSS